MNTYSNRQNYELPTFHSTRGGPRGPSGPSKCWRCGDFGHKFYECPKEREREEGNLVYQQHEGENKRIKFEDEDVALMVSSSSNSRTTDDWFIDSAASSHMSFNKALLSDYHEYKKPEMVSLGDDYSIPAVGQGKLRLPFIDENGTHKHLALDRVLYVPDLAKNLLSVRYMTQNKGAVVCFDASKCTVSKGDSSFVIGSCVRGNLYRINQPKHNQKVMVENVNVTAHDCRAPTLNTWHQRFGHLNYKYVEELIKNKLVHGMDCCHIDGKLECEACVLGKMNRRSFPKKSNGRARKPLEIIHSDVCGPMQINSIGGSRYILSFIDDFSRYAMVYFLKSKSEVIEKFKQYVQLVENSVSKKGIQNLFIWNSVKAMRSDNGGEYSSTEFKEFCAAKGISRQFTNPYSPEQNGVAERFNRTLMESVRSMIFHAKVPLSFWAEAVNTSVYVHNRSPTAALNHQTPYECWFKNKPDVSDLRVFGCVCFYHVPSSQRRKLDPKSSKAIFMGYPTDTKGYKLYDIESRKFKRKEVQNVIFHESEFHDFQNVEVNKENRSANVIFPFDDEPAVVSTIYPLNSTTEPVAINENETFGLIQRVDENQTIEENIEQIERTGDTETVGELLENAGEIVNPVDNTDDNNVYAEQVGGRDSGVQKTYEETFMREVEALPSKRERKPNRRYHEDVNIVRELPIDNITLTSDIDEPVSLNAALTGLHAAQWKNAMETEYQSLVQNETWSLVPRPKHMNIVGNRWVFKLKRDANGNISRFKARLVAQGFSQTRGVDYEEVFSPVIRFSTLRTLLALANANNWEVHQMDVATAFLNAELDCDVFMEQPKGFVDAKNRDFVCKLKKGLYGLKQSARCWNATLDSFLKSNGFRQSDADHCIYIKHIVDDGCFVIFAVYVDDIIPVSNDMKLLHIEKEILCKKFVMVDNGDADYFLNLSIKRNREERILSISQPLYLQSILKKI